MSAVAGIPSLSQLLAWPTEHLTQAADHLPGLGPKRVRRLYEELGVDSLETLRSAAEEQKIRKIKESGAMFQSHIDGSRHLFTPENVMDIQRTIGADIITSTIQRKKHPLARLFGFGR